jgi:hypothetical protein
MEIGMKNRRKGDRKHRMIAMLVVLGSFYIAMFVWPTPWRYDRVGRNPVRTNRVTGMVEILNLEGWQPALPPLPVRRGRPRPRPARATMPCEAPGPEEKRAIEPVALPPLNAT